MHKRTSVSVIANIISCVVTLSISFVLTPYYVERLGDAAYGYVGLANTFIGYASIITIAFNSMAQRFITVSYHQKDMERANTYFWSVFAAEGFLSILILIIGLGISSKVDRFFLVEPALIDDVKITFLVAVVNYVINTFLSIFATACFVKSRVEISAILTIAANISKVFLLVPLLFFFMPKIYYIAAGGLIYTVVLYGGYAVVARKLLPEIRFQKTYVKKSAVKTMLQYGVWSSISRVSATLMNGLDLVIANWMIGDQQMGLLSIAKTFSTAFDALYAAIATAFHPRFTILYAQGKKDEMIQENKKCMRYISILLVVPCAGIIAFGKEFYLLWMPYKTIEEINVLQILTLLTIMPSIANAMVEGIMSVPGIYKQVKLPVIFNLITGVLSLITTLSLLKLTKFGIYAIAGVSSCYVIAYAFLIVPTYVARIVKRKWWEFYPTLMHNCVLLIVTVFLFQRFRNFYFATTWKGFFMQIFISGIFGYIVCIAIGLNQKERLACLKVIKARLKIIGT